MASSYFKLGEYEQSLYLNKKVIKIRCKILGKNHPDTLSSLQSLASVYSELGSYQKAKTLQKDVYDLSKRILGETHPQTIKAKESLNNILNLLIKD